MVTSGHIESPAVQVRRCEGVQAHEGDVNSKIKKIKTKNENILLIPASCISLNKKILIPDRFVNEKIKKLHFFILRRYSRPDLTYQGKVDNKELYIFYDWNKQKKEEI